MASFTLQLIFNSGWFSQALSEKKKTKPWPSQIFFLSIWWKQVIKALKAHSWYKVASSLWGNPSEFKVSLAQVTATINLMGFVFFPGNFCYHSLTSTFNFHLHNYGRYQADNFVSNSCLSTGIHTNVLSHFPAQYWRTDHTCHATNSTKIHTHKSSYFLIQLLCSYSPTIRFPREVWHLLIQSTTPEKHHWIFILCKVSKWIFESLKIKKVKY